MRRLEIKRVFEACGDFFKRKSDGCRVPLHLGMGSIQNGFGVVLRPLYKGVYWLLDYTGPMAGLVKAFIAVLMLAIMASWFVLWAFCMGRGFLFAMLFFGYIGLSGALILAVGWMSVKKDDEDEHEPKRAFELLFENS